MTILRRILLLVTVGLVVAACGGDSDDTVSTTDDTLAPETPVTDPVDDTLPLDAAGDGDAAGGTQLAGTPSTYAIGTLTVTISHPEAEDRTYVLSCLGDTATATGAAEGVDADAACRQLTEPAAIARLVDGAPADRMCTEIYGGPDLAVVTGELDGQAVDTTIDRANGCGIDDWDSVLGAVLPPALGITE